MESKTTKITTIKNEVQLREWQEQIKAQQSSGLTVQSRKSIFTNHPQNGVRINQTIKHNF